MGTPKTYNPNFYAELANAEGGNFWFDSRNHLICWSLQRFFSGCTKFLEIGCGTGYVLKGITMRLPRCHIFGSDFFFEGLRFARARLPAISFCQIDARMLPYKERFDVIGAFDVLEHIEEDECVLTQIYTAVIPGGGIVITVPQHMFLWGHMDTLSCHKRRYNREELIRKVEQAGFRVKYISSFVSFLLPLLWLSRLIKRSSTNIMEELRIGKATNFLLSLIMLLEFGILKYGQISLPVGGSLLLVAIKPRKGIHEDKDCE